MPSIFWMKLALPRTRLFFGTKGFIRQSFMWGQGWKAKVLEIRENGESDEIGIEASAETRTAADDSAERKLRRLVGH